MSSQAQSILSSVAWGLGFSVLGGTLGVLTDGILGPRLISGMKLPLLGFVTQLAIGLAVLCETIAIIMPAATEAPLGDGLMFFWFCSLQPTLLMNAVSAAATLRTSLFGSPAAAQVGATPPPPATSAAAMSMTAASDPTASLSASTPGPTHSHKHHHHDVRHGRTPFNGSDLSAVVADNPEPAGWMDYDPRPAAMPF